jgi:hypothetical protein
MSSSAATTTVALGFAILGADETVVLCMDAAKLGPSTAPGRVEVAAVASELPWQAARAPARRARTRRVIGKVAPDPALRVIGDGPVTPASVGTRAPRMPTKRAPRKVAADPALRVVGNDIVTVAATAAEPTGSVHLLGNG